MGEKHHRGAALSKRVLVLVEGQTEEQFVKTVLYDHLLARNIIIIPKILVTKQVKSGMTFKGGITSYAKIKRDLGHLLNDTGAVVVTSFLDYYGLPVDFPGIKTRPSGAPHIRVQHLEKAWEADVGSRRFKSFLMLHEFEALLYEPYGYLPWR